MNDRRDTARGPRHSSALPARMRRSHPTPRRRPGRLSRRLLMACGVISLVIVLGATALWSLGSYALGRIDRVDAFGGLDHRPGSDASGAMNILLVGSDRREGIPASALRRLHLGDDAGRRSDTMILAHVSRDRGRVVLVSLPRDSWVTIPAHRTADGKRVGPDKNKLNAAYAYGGPRLLVSTVEHATGLRVDHYVEVNFLGFVKVINALGGVDVCTPSSIHDPKSGLTLPAGRSHLSGVQGLEYVRARKSIGDGSDLGRIQRQQKFLAAMVQRATSSGTMLNPVRFTHFLNAALSTVRADRAFSTSDMRDLALGLRDVSPGNIRFLTVPLSDSNFNGGSVLWDDRRAGAIFRDLRNDQPIVHGRHPAKRGGGPSVTISPERIAVSVYNGTTAAGLASRTARELRGVGFIVDDPPRNAQVRDATATVVQYGPSRDDSARTVHAALPGSHVQRVPSLGDGLRVIVGSSYSGTEAVHATRGSSAGKGFDTRDAAQNVCSGS
ncbi:MAG: LCP family protein [Streptosporangiaceae bacterium]